MRRIVHLSPAMLTAVVCLTTSAPDAYAMGPGEECGNCGNPGASWCQATYGEQTTVCHVWQYSETGNHDRGTDTHSVVAEGWWAALGDCTPHGSCGGGSLAWEDVEQAIDTQDLPRLRAIIDAVDGADVRYITATARLEVSAPCNGSPTGTVVETYVVPSESRVWAATIAAE
jgi:hypothetical protein